MADSRTLTDNLRTAAFTSGTTSVRVPGVTTPITVTSGFGRVVLQGTVRSVAEARDIEARILSVAEGVQIDNQLIVVPQAERLEDQRLPAGINP